MSFISRPRRACHAFRLRLRDGPTELELKVGGLRQPRAQYRVWPAPLNLCDFSDKTIGGRGNLPNAERRMPNAERRTPNAERRTPNAERRTPNAERRTPNAERRTPNAERRTPNAERRISVSGISCETCAFCKHGSHRDYRYLGQVSPVLYYPIASLYCAVVFCGV